MNFRVDNSEDDTVVENDTEFSECVGVYWYGGQIIGFPTVRVSGGSNILIEGIVNESKLIHPTFTIGGEALPSRNVILRNINHTLTSATVAVTEFIEIKNACQGVIFDNIRILNNATGGQNNKGWIKIGTAFNVSFRNINIHGAAGTFDSTNLIFSTSLGPDFIDMVNISATSDSSSPSILMRADNMKITHSNVPITISASSKFISLEDCTEAITNNSDAVISRTNYGDQIVCNENQVLCNENQVVLNSER